MPHMQQSLANASGKYKVIAELGQGGMANVYLAVARGPSGFNKLVVLKSLRSDISANPEFMEMFLSEARLAARLNHPHVVQTYEVGDYAGRPVIVMEYLEGQTLANIDIRASDEAFLPAHAHPRAHRHPRRAFTTPMSLADFAGKPLGIVHRGRIAAEHLRHLRRPRESARFRHCQGRQRAGADGDGGSQGQGALHGT